ncbi:MAG: SMC family ATPase [Gemmatimonadetes bacterium]|nr:SMC family ATPase [Gemmatimonadota bacterium]
MRLNRLRLTNFRQHADSDLLFEGGLTGIIGPNGVGKSTLLEAMAWALYGGDTARGGKDTIRFARALPRSQVRVELEFELGGHRYRVVRGLTIAELYLDGGDQPIANSASAVGEMLQRRLGMSRSEFFNTYFTGQKELAVMSSLTATERAQFLSRVLGYERLRVAQELADERRRDIRSEVAGMRSGMPDSAALEAQESESQAAVTEARSRLADAEIERSRVRAQLDALGPRWAVAQRQRDELQQLEADVRVTEIELAAQRRNVERLTAELRHVDEARVALAPLSEQLAPFDQMGHDLTRLRDLAAHDGRRRALLEQEAVMGGELATMREQRDATRASPAREEEVTLELETRRRQLEDAEGRLELRRTEWVRDRQEAETRRNALRAQFAEMRDQRDRLVARGEQGVCPTCQRPLLDHYRQVLDVLDNQLETVSADGSYFKSRLEQLENMPDDVAELDEQRRRVQQDVGALERRLTRTQMNVQQLKHLERDIAVKEQRHASLVQELAGIPAGYDAARHRSVESEFERLVSLSSQANRLTTQIEREPTFRRELDNVARSVESLAARHSDILSRRTALALSEEEFGLLRDQHAAASAQLQAATLATATATTELTGAQAALERAAKTRQELVRAAERVAVLEREKQLHDELHRAYSDLRTDLNFAMRPELSELASAFLTELTDARYTELELDDKYRIVVLEEGVPKPVISGGEEDLANLVLRLAISQMIAERAGQSFSLLVLDEVFGSLDETRRQNVVALLRGLQDRFEQVILITHIDDVRDGLDQVMEVRIDERTGASTVVLSAAKGHELADALVAGSGGQGAAGAESTAEPE